MARLSTTTPTSASISRDGRGGYLGPPIRKRPPGPIWKRRVRRIDPPVGTVPHGIVNSPPRPQPRGLKVV